MGRGSVGGCSNGIDYVEGSHPSTALGSHQHHNNNGHRYLDGTKVYQLHSASGEVVASVDAADVTHLEACGLIAGNMKFPVAVYLLTEPGAKIVNSRA